MSKEIEELKRNIMDAYHNFYARYGEYPSAFLLNDDDWDLMREEANRMIAQYSASGKADPKKAHEDSLLKFNGIQVCSLKTARKKLDPFENDIAYLDPDIRMDWLMWVAASYLDDDRPPFGGDMLRKQKVTSDEVFSLSARISTLIKGFMLSDWEEQKEILMKGLLHEFPDETREAALDKMHVDKILNKLTKE